VQKTFMSPLDKWDPTDFSNTMLVWDSKARKIVQELKGDPIPLAPVGISCATARSACAPS